MKTWGIHTVLDAHRCLNVRCPNTIIRFTKQLVKDIDMVPYGEPIIKHFGTGNKAGFTLVQLIETSNITAHFCDESGDVYLDVFSCKEYDPKIVIQTFESYFYPKSINLSVLYRQAQGDLC